MSTLTDYLAELDDLAGLDLEEPEATRLINEARRKLVTESDWRRANVEVGPTVAAQALYDAPEGLHRYLRVTIDGYPCFATDELTVNRLTKDFNYQYSLPSGSVFHYSTQDDTAAEKLGLFPAPSVSGLEITATIVQLPDDIPATGEDPDVPLNSQWAIRNYVAAVSYALTEDSKDLADSYRAEFDRAVEELRRLRNSRARRGPIQAKTVGYQIAEVG